MRILSWTRLEMLGIQCQRQTAGQPWTQFQANFSPETATGLNHLVHTKSPLKSIALIRLDLEAVILLNKMTKQHSKSSCVKNLEIICGPTAADMHPSRSSCQNYTGLYLESRLWSLMHVRLLLSALCAGCITVNIGGEQPKP